MIRKCSTLPNSNCKRAGMEFGGLGFGGGWFVPCAIPRSRGAMLHICIRGYGKARERERVFGKKGERNMHCCCAAAAAALWVLMKFPPLRCGGGGADFTAGI